MRSLSSFIYVLIITVGFLPAIGFSAKNKDTMATSVEFDVSGIVQKSKGKGKRAGYEIQLERGEDTYHVDEMEEKTGKKISEAVALITVMKNGGGTSGTVFEGVFEDNIGKKVRVKAEGYIRFKKEKAIYRISKLIDVQGEL